MSIRDMLGQVPDPPLDPNEALLDALVRRQIDIMRYSDSVRRRIGDILDSTEGDIVDRIQGRLSRGRSPARLQALLEAVRALRATAWRSAADAWAEELQEFARLEAGAVQGIVLQTSPVVVETILPAAQLLRSVVVSRPYEGRTLRQWARSLEREDLRRIDAAIRRGVVQGETTPEIARRVVGTARLQGTDGVTQISRRNAQAITRTAVNHIANETRREFLKANSDLFRQEQYVATLDSRTTPICRALDGQKFDVGQGAYPPQHWNCRSLRVPVYNGDTLSRRPAKPTTERGLLRDYARRNDLSRTPTSRDALPRGHRGSFDEFKRQRVREMTERVPGSTNYQQWLSRQSREFQEDVLGEAKARLFREGNLPLTKFVNRNGGELTLDQLRSRYPDAWRQAGLDGWQKS